MIACVSHSGTWEDEKVSEDETLAKEVPDIDLIISGHTHTQLDQPIRHGNTYIVSCGEYGRNLGSISMTQKKDKRWKMNTYKLISVTKNVKSDQAAQKQIDKFMDTVDTNYLVNFGYTKDQVLAENDIKFNSLEEMETKHEDTHINESILSEEILEDQKKNRIDHMTYLPGMEDIGSENHGSGDRGNGSL